MEKIKELSIDLETFSSIDIKKSGVYKYVEAEDFEILLMAVSINNGPVKVYDLAKSEKIPDEIIEAILDEKIIKWAFNANFERICLSAYLRKNYPNKFVSYSIDEDTVGSYLDPASWKCTMIWSAYMGLPLSLEGVGIVLGLKDKKLSEGKDLIRYFCQPCKETKTNNMRTRNLPHHDKNKWEQFISYNKRDVEVELAIKEKLSKYPVPDFVWEEYHLDQEINDRGILLDMDLVNEAIILDEKSKSDITNTLKSLTGLDNPNSVLQMREWLNENGLETDTLDKKAVNELIKTASPKLVKVLKLRQKLAKSSVRKYQAMQNAVCLDGRARGMFQFYGGNRTGRWAGRIIQLQNLPQNHMQDLEHARTIIRNGNFDDLELLFEDIPDTLSQLIRTSFVPKKGYKFIVSDFSAIEARVIAHLAGESWREEVFKNGGDIYCASASKMFHVPVEKHGINAHLRQKGKIAELALGYGGSVGALKAMGALDMGINEDELQPLVDAWRESNPQIVDLWWAVDRAVKATIKTKTMTKTHGIKFMYKSGMLFIHLPSGRNLCYVKPKIGENRFGGESVTYEGVGTNKKWERIESYGPKFVENIVQAISRDILAFSMRTLSHTFISGHVHDELIIEASEKVSLDAITNQMARNPSWMPNLLLDADGFETRFYKKD